MGTDKHTNSQIYGSGALITELQRACRWAKWSIIRLIILLVSHIVCMAKIKVILLILAVCKMCVTHHDQAHQVSLPSPIKLEDPIGIWLCVQISLGSQSSECHWALHVTSKFYRAVWSVYWPWRNFLISAIASIRQTEPPLSFFSGFFFKCLGRESNHGHYLSRISSGYGPALVGFG